MTIRFAVTVLPRTWYAHCLRAVVVVLVTLPAVGWGSEGDLIVSEGFETAASGESPKGWLLGPTCTIEQGHAAQGAHYLRCGCGDPVKPTCARLRQVELRPRTGYVARCRIRAAGAAHYTLGLLKPGGAFFVCRDGYLGSTDHWDEIALPFRTEDQAKLTLYLGRRYGAGSVLYDAVRLEQDDTVKVGDVSPRVNAMPAATSRERARGYIISSQHWMAPVYPTYCPTRQQVVTRLACRLCAGEYEPVTVSLTALHDLDNVGLAVEGDLVGPGGSVIPAAEVQVGLVGTIKRWLTCSAPLKPGQRYERRPMFILPRQVTDIPARETRRFWLTVHAADGLAPGLYRSKLVLTASGVPQVELPLRVTVLPLKLPEPQVTYGMYYRHTHQYPEFCTEEFLRRCFDDMRRHGCNSASVYVDIERKREDGTYEPNFDGDTARYCLDKQMSLLDGAGLLVAGRPLLLLATGASDGRFHNEERLVAAVEEHRRAHQWPELLFYLVDEPGPSQYELAKQLNDVVHRVPGVRTTTAIGEPGELGSHYDVWIVTESVDGIDGLVERAEAMEREVWTYHCQWNGSQPWNDRYFTGLHMWTARLGGNWQWCYAEQGSGRLTQEGELQLALPAYEDPWRYAYVLPGPECNIPTLGWEGRREGIDDYRYLQALRDELSRGGEHPDPELARRQDRARGFLRSIDRTARRPIQPRRAAQPSRVYDHRIHPGLAPEDYDAIRARVVGHILALRRARTGAELRSNQAGQGATGLP